MKVEIVKIPDKRNEYDHEQTLVCVVEATPSEKAMMRSFGNSYSTPHEIKHLLFAELPLCLEEDMDYIKEAFLKEK